MRITYSGVLTKIVVEYSALRWVIIFINTYNGKISNCMKAHFLSFIKTGSYSLEFVFNILAFNTKLATFDRFAWFDLHGSYVRQCYTEVFWQLCFTCPWDRYLTCLWHCCQKHAFHWNTCLIYRLAEGFMCYRYGTAMSNLTYLWHRPFVFFYVKCGSCLQCIIISVILIIIRSGQSICND